MQADHFTDYDNIDTNVNIDQCNFERGKITRLYSLGGSIGLTVWLYFAIACFG